MMSVRSKRTNRLREKKRYCEKVVANNCSAVLYHAKNLFRKFSGQGVGAE